LALVLEARAVIPDRPPVLLDHTVAHGAAMLDELRDAFRRYVVFPTSHALDAAVLWSVATHAQRVATHATRLVLTSPERRCGKSRLLDVIAATCHRPLITANATVAAIFRTIVADDPPTLLLDEADSVFTKRPGNEGAEELRGLLNAGFGRGRPSIRCVGPQQTPTEFATFAMAALAVIGDGVPDTITDRAVVIRMRRRARNERVAPYRQRRDEEPLQELRDCVAVWVEAHLDELRDAEPYLPVEDRAADVWEPLVAVADLAGGTWPDVARAAAVALTREQDEADSEDSLGRRLLGDLRDVFGSLGGSVASSEELVSRLHGIPEAPWAAFEFTQRDLSRRLRPYGVSSERVRVPRDGKEVQVRGYRLEALADVFARYLPSQSVTPSQPQVDPVTLLPPVTDTSVTSASSVTGFTRDCDAVTDCDAPPGGDLGPVFVAGQPCVRCVRYGPEHEGAHVSEWPA
jgi:hypothetical protein